MTMPDTIQAPRSAAAEAIAKSGGAEGGKVAGKGHAKAEGGDFATALADMMGAPSTEAAAGTVGAEAAESEATDGAAVVILDDLAKAAALLPAVAVGEIGAGEATAEADPKALPAPDAALQAVLAGLVAPKTEAVGEGAGEDIGEDTGEAEGSAEADALAQELLADPVAALGLAPVPAEVPLAEGEAEAALGNAVAAAVAGGIVQPMAARPVRTAGLPPGLETAQQAAANGMETSAQAIEGNRPEFAQGEGEGADPGARRDMTLIQQAISAAERQVAKAPAAAETVVETTSVSTAAQASQPLPQSGQVAQQTNMMPGLPGNPAPIAMMRPGWEGAIAERIEAELSGDGQIELDLTPEHLGRLKIRLDMVDGQTMVRFVTETPEAARLIQQNEHRLSESLSRAGLSLGGQETASRDPQGERQARGGGEGGGMSYERPAEAKVGTMTVPRRAAPGLVNLVA